jgi:hypothetical protein
VDETGAPIGEPVPVEDGSGELPDQQQATYRLSGTMDGEAVRDWIHVPALERQASLRISRPDQQADLGAAQPGMELVVRVENEGTVALGPPGAGGVVRDRP